MQIKGIVRAQVLGNLSLKVILKFKLWVLSQGMSFTKAKNGIHINRQKDILEKGEN